MARSFISGLFSTVAREAIRAARTAARESERQSKLHYLANREQEAKFKTRELNGRIEEIESVLAYSLKLDCLALFASLIDTEKFKEFILPSYLQSNVEPPLLSTYLAPIKEPSFPARLLPGLRRAYQRDLDLAHKQFADATAEYQATLRLRAEKTHEIQSHYEQDKGTFEVRQHQRNQEVEEFRKKYNAGDPESIVAFTELVLERSTYPEGFPQEFRVAYAADNRELVLEYQLPGLEVIPAIAEYRYIKSKDAIIQKTQKLAETKKVYQDLVASVCLRTIHEVFEAEQLHVKSIVFNGFVQGKSPSTGEPIRPHVISVRTTRQRFGEIHLNQVEKAACLRNLGAQVSRHPEELQPVRPIIDFNMVDRRFINESDVLSELESRPNLMDLNPFEFETLVANLFNQMGLDTKQTRSHRDGGVDSVAFDNRPILGGKVVIQAKRHKNTVGVAAVRDLYGTMLNEGANKGILVTTSGYGPDAFEFAKEKPIELIDGGGLLYLLKQVGIDSRIVFKEDTVF